MEPEPQEVAIRRVANGLAMTNEEGLEYVFEEDEEHPTTHVVNLLYNIIDLFAPSECESRYAKERIYIEVRPGDKYEG